MSPAPGRMRALARAVAAGAVAGAACVAKAHQEAKAHQGAFCSPAAQRRAPAAPRGVAASPAASRARGRWASQGSREHGCAAGAVLAAAVAVAAAAARPRRGASRRSRLARASGEAPELKSERDVDYSKLKDLLSSSDFRGADAETRSLLIQLGGPAAVKRGWVYFIEVRSMPETDLQTIDSLWQHYSKGKFGFAPQRKIWRQCREQFDKFALEVSWFTDKWQNRNWPDEFIYSADAPSGHLPLTNCIRGAQVLQELLAHPAFEKKKVVSPKETGRKSGLSLL